MQAVTGWQAALGLTQQLRASTDGPRNAARGAAAGAGGTTACSCGRSRLSLGCQIYQMASLQVVCSSRPALPARGLAARGSALRRPALGAGRPSCKLSRCAAAPALAILHPPHCRADALWAGARGASGCMRFRQRISLQPGPGGALLPAAVAGGAARFAAQARRCFPSHFLRPAADVPSKYHFVLCRRQEAQWVAAAGGGDGGSSGGSSGGSGGSGGGGGDDGEQPSEKKPVFGWKGWQDRVAADPQFVYKVVVEQVSAWSEPGLNGSPERLLGTGCCNLSAPQDGGSRPSVSRGLLQQD